MSLRSYEDQLYAEERKRLEIKDRVECPECKGIGFFYNDAGPSGATIDCSECGGEGGWVAEPLSDAGYRIRRHVETGRATLRATCFRPSDQAPAGLDASRFNQAQGEAA